MAKLIRRQVKASTLIEVIVAMVIILVIFTLSLRIYNNVLISSPSVKKKQADALIAELIRQSVEEKNWKDEEITRDSLRFKKVVVDDEKYADLVTVTVTAFIHDRQISRSSLTVRKSADEN